MNVLPFQPLPEGLGLGVSLFESIFAVEMVQTEPGLIGVGNVIKLPACTTLEFCGPGYDERTVQARTS